jgi:hypothetical protein
MVSEWYGRKILCFLKLLFLEFEDKGEDISFGEMENCVVEFTLRFGNETVMELARSVFQCMKNSSRSIEKQVELF